MCAALPAAADVIHLKNGETITADRVEESANSVRYEIGDDSYTIPRARVERIEVSPPGTASREVPLFTPELQAGDEQNLLPEVVQGREVNRSALSAVEARGNPKATAIAYYLAAKLEFEKAQFADSRRDFETALRYQDDNPAILTYYAALLVRTGNALDGISYAQRATRIVPDSADAFAVLGFAQFSANRLRDAIESWKKSLSFRPDATIQQMLARAERESGAERNYSERETGHFALHFEGNQSSESFREQLLATLEAQYQDLYRTFGGGPSSSIQVVLYTKQTFFDVTRAPSWTGALNDGKLRIPLYGVDSVTPELARVLRHELTHSFVNQLSAGRCPAWLNEGIAQMLEPRSLGGRTAWLARLFQADRQLPLNMLEGSFSSLRTQEAELAYDESLAVTGYITSRYGMADLVSVLQHMGQGSSPESALRSVLHTGYDGLEQETRTYLNQGAN